jgi:hypothetical protein
LEVITAMAAENSTSGPWHLRTANGRLPIVREIKRPHGEASHYEATIGAGNTLSGPIVAKLDFGYGHPGMNENARILGAAWQTRHALERAFVILEGLRLVVDWELAPPIKREIADVAKLAEDALKEGGLTNG